jgi:hypothetical protein
LNKTNFKPEDVKMVKQTWREILTAPDMIGLWLFLAFIGVMTSIVGAAILRMAWIA